MPGDFFGRVSCGIYFTFVCKDLSLRNTG
jgi:hypothetical protein